MKFILSALILFNFIACSSYVNRIHSQIAREEGHSKAPRRGYDPYAKYRNNRYNRAHDKRPINNPVTLGGYANTANTRNMAPSNQRQYQNRGRVRADDLKDNSGNGSLWSSKNSESYLFVTNNIKKKGDIVVIEVMAKLKETIQEELKRTFPEKKKKKSSKDGEGSEEKEEPAPAATANNANPAGEVYDKISTQVVEQINKDYLLVRGRKEVLFKDYKRFIEVQGLVPKKYINDNDSVDSDSILEPKVTVLRY